MSLRSDIQEKLHTAMKSGDKEIVASMRLLMSSIKNKEIEQKKELNDEEVQAVVAREVKQLQDALKDFEAGGRADLVEKNKAEIEIFSAYLPKQMSDEELSDIVEKAIESTGSAGLQDIGKVMGVVMKEAKGKADGNRVREIASKKLS